MLTNGPEQKILFFDLADPEKRSKKDILHALSLIKQFGTHFKVVLGLNKKEACEIAEIIGYEVDDYDKQDLRLLNRWIRDYLSIFCCVIHPVKEACAGLEDGYFYVSGPYCEKPVMTTGAGDNFNAGFLTGLLMGADIESCLLMGTVTSGYYVRKAKSPGLQDVLDFIELWIQGRL
jgi:sugar/nucleoside kinase (ribokinase family)